VRRSHAPFVRTELYGEGEPALDDPAELYHEASKLYPALAFRQAAGMARLSVSDELQEVSMHATRRNAQLPSYPLPRPLRPRCSLWAALDARRSRREFGGALDRQRLATLLDAGYGVRRRDRRTVPSGGALYPLELYLLEHGVFRYDPELHALEEHDDADPWSAFVAACPVPEVANGAAAVILVLAVFGRSRFKYGQRGYRFTVLEAGHVVQNVVLAAAALDIAALPFGGFYDAKIDALVGADGVEESVLYGVVLGGSK
jgi:SagB-type dehydrogenase family enzyme